jgi:hypothetical protein
MSVYFMSLRTTKEFPGAENRKWNSFKCMKENPTTANECPNEDIIQKVHSHQDLIPRVLINLLA